MRYWILPVLIVTLFTACGRQTAFEYFTKLDSRHEHAVTNLRRITFKEGNETTAMISTIFLNPVDPLLYGNQSYFLIALYDKRDRTLDDYNITLNGSPAVGIVLLDDNCSLRELMPLNNPWNSYYEAVFAPQKETNLTLRFETYPSLTGEATYSTDQ